MCRRLARVPEARSGFAGFRFPPEVIMVAVRWYLRYGLSYRDVEELLADRGIEIDHATIYNHGRLKARLRPMRGLKRLRSTRVISAGHAFVQNLCRGHYVSMAMSHRLPAALPNSPVPSDRASTAENLACSRLRNRPVRGEQSARDRW